MSAEPLNHSSHLPDTDNTRRGLRSLSNTKPLYFLPRDPLANEVLIPGFEESTVVECMMGFFSSQALASLAPGLATYINSTQGVFRLIISPLVSAEDLAAMAAGTLTSEAVATKLLEPMFITADLIERHTLECLTYLLSVGRLEIQVVLMEDALFHPKVWLFRDGDDVMAVHGSSNATFAGISRNIEQMTVSKSWQDPDQNYITQRLRDQFTKLWNQEENNCIVVSLPQAVREKFFQTYAPGIPPAEDDLRRIYRSALDKESKVIPFISDAFFVPSELNFNAGPFAHQGQAVSAWCKAGFRGILEMATGSGKTITAMIAANQLFRDHSPLLIVVAAPYKPLIEQWCAEIVPFGLEPTNLSELAGPHKRAEELQRIGRRFRFGSSQVAAVVVSHDTLCSLEFQASVASISGHKLLIADEVHNLGRPSFIGDPPEFFDFRLGLSATPVRQYDQEGTEALFEFFGPVVFQFTLEQAIGRCLVDYDYYIHPVSLNSDEMDRWYEFTTRINKVAWRSESDEPDEFLTKLLRDRRAVLETAEAKLAKLSELLDKEDLSNLRHTLIYTTDKAPAQLKQVNRLLSDKGVMFHQLTEVETANPEQTRNIIKSFQDGEIQVLTAKRVLDEGVNIPQISKAYILASTTVERQWIQRRGRLLRTCSEIGKTHSVIHDFVVLPPDSNGSLDQDARKLVSSELRRAFEFASLARNAGRPDGPLKVIDLLVSAASGLGGIQNAT